MKFAIQAKHQAWREDVIECCYWLTQKTRGDIKNGIWGLTQKIK